MTRLPRGLIAWSDIPAALGLLSRLPIPVDSDRATKRGARAAWAWPLAGFVLGAMAAIVGALSLWFGLAPTLAAGLALATQVILTGAMHEDGLADCADGFWGGWIPERRLEIMKDSRIGAYGVIVLVLTLILRWHALALLFEVDALWAPLIAVAGLSRAPMVAMMALLPNARSGGLSRAVGRPSPIAAILAGVISVLVGLLLLGSVAILLALTNCAIVLGWAALCRRKIGGQTGDTLGALQQLSEIGALLVLAAGMGLG
ncbi:adenosylcobinamide-GDP ribazoletransferase [Flavimaricola marinus]|uniref:Adenosylcobinamide-GDP ribazoletransferase n=1 Tax=Flavimaricola marinus TaxID=1819565 RepID=A0A238LLR4_9RHOB|nr:adenosylcobinamide-GDP ribazoletransferase [Flavimaricola marinus]SMY09886.1 Cobalamin synthase [Flavimaricola marinus]